RSIEHAGSFADRGIWLYRIREDVIPIRHPAQGFVLDSKEICYYRRPPGGKIDNVIGPSRRVGLCKFIPDPACCSRDRKISRFSRSVKSRLFYTGANIERDVFTILESFRLPRHYLSLGGLHDD